MKFVAVSSIILSVSVSVHFLDEFLDFVCALHLHILPLLCITIIIIEGSIQMDNNDKNKKMHTISRNSWIGGAEI